MRSALRTRSCQQLLFMLVLICLAAALADRASAESGSPEVRYLDTKATLPSEDHILLRGAFEITGPPHCWYSLYFQLRLDAATPLKQEGKKGFVKFWNKIFTPENVSTARYTDCRLDIPVKEIETAANLPKGKRSVLWAICDLWDNQGKKYIGSGWEVRAPLIVAVDKAGKILKIETFNTARFSPKENHRSARINVKECELDLKGLKLKGGAKLYRAVGSRHKIYDILLMGGHQAELASLNRGFFFEPPDTPEKARELVEIGYPRAVVINTADQYQAIVKALRAKGWLPGKHIKVGRAPAFGVTVRAEPQLGHRVRALMVDYSGYYGLGLRSVIYREFAVALDGRLGIVRETECIQAPETPYGAPPGWTQPLPLGPEGYNETLNSVLTATGSRTMPGVTVTEAKTSINCAEDADPAWYIEDYKDWPEHAAK